MFTCCLCFNLFLVCSLPFCHSSPRWPLNVQCTHTMFQTSLIMSYVLVPPFCLFFSASDKTCFTPVTATSESCGGGECSEVVGIIFLELYLALCNHTHRGRTGNPFPFLSQKTYGEDTPEGPQEHSKRESLYHQSPWWMFLVVAACAVTAPWGNAAMAIAIGDGKKG